MICRLNEDLQSIGYGKNLKCAEQDAAEKLIKEIKNNKWIKKIWVRFFDWEN